MIPKTVIYLIAYREKLISLATIAWDNNLKITGGLCVEPEPLACTIKKCLDEMCKILCCVESLLKKIPTLKDTHCGQWFNRILSDYNDPNKTVSIPSIVFGDYEAI